MLVEEMELLRNLLVMSLKTLPPGVFFDLFESLGSDDGVSGKSVGVTAGASRGGRVIGTRLPPEVVEDDFFGVTGGDFVESSSSVVMAVVSQGGGGSWVVTVLVLVKVVAGRKRDKHQGSELLPL